MLYALSNASQIITLAHLQAALALWAYCDTEQLALCDKVSLEQLVANAKLAAEVAGNAPPGLGTGGPIPEAAGGA